MSVQQQQRFAEDGFLVVEDVLDPLLDFAPVITELNGILDGIAAELASPLSDPRVWADNWLALRDALAEQANPVFNRWTADAPVCA